MFERFGAAIGKIDPGQVPAIPKGATAAGTISGLLDVAYFAAGVSGVIVIILAGYFYVTSAGDPSKAKRAKDTILYAVIGLVVVALAFVITRFVSGRFQ